MIGFETFASEGLVSQDRLTVVIKATPTQRTTGAVSAVGGPRMCSNKPLARDALRDNPINPAYASCAAGKRISLDCQRVRSRVARLLIFEVEKRGSSAYAAPAIGAARSSLRRQQRDEHQRPHKFEASVLSNLRTNNYRQTVCEP
jgi:hypothetical protein